MSDELDSFFAKKKAAKKKKMPLIQDTDSLAKKLEKAVKQQELIDKDREDQDFDDDFHKDRQQHEFQNVEKPEDSEWLEVPENLEIDLAGKGLQDLDIEEINDDEKLADDEKIEKPKTWGSTAPQDPAAVKIEENPENQEIQPAEIDKAPPVVEKKVYKPPSARFGAGKESKQVEPNLQDAEEFPSLAAAEDFEKKELEKKKQKAQRAKEFEDNEKQIWARRQKELTTGAAQNVTPKCAVESTAPSADANPQKYVPPHLRKLDQSQVSAPPPPNPSRRI